MFIFERERERERERECARASTQGGVEREGNAGFEAGSRL